MVLSCPPTANLRVTQIPHDTNAFLFELWQRQALLITGMPRAWGASTCWSLACLPWAPGCVDTLAAYTSSACTLTRSGLDNQAWEAV